MQGGIVRTALNGNYSAVGIPWGGSREQAPDRYIDKCNYKKLL